MATVCLDHDARGFILEPFILLGRHPCGFILNPFSFTTCIQAPIIDPPLKKIAAETGYRKTATVDLG